LQAQIGQLRRTLGVTAIVTSEAGYALDVGPDDLDAARIEQLGGPRPRLLQEVHERMEHVPANSGCWTGHECGEVLAGLGRSWQGLPRGTMAAGKLGAEILKPIPVSCAP
jgi:hypothetical protein